MSRSQIRKRVLTLFVVPLLISSCQFFGQQESLAKFTRGELLFSDDFSTVSDEWYVGNSADGANYYSNGAYFLESVQTTRIQGSNLNQDYADIAIKVTIDSTQGQGNGGFGIFCNYQDDQNYYLLRVSTTNYASIWKLVNNEYTPLIDWQFFEQIDWDEERFDMMAVCSQGQLILGLDEQILMRTNDEIFGAGRAGLAASAYDDEGYTVAIDSIEIYSADCTFSGLLRIFCILQGE